jgi:hypothetical protein
MLRHSLLLVVGTIFSVAHGLAAGTSERWNPFRFIQQSSKFVSLLPPGLTNAGTAMTVIRPGQVLFQASGSSNAKQPFQFAPLDDVVMGGVSSSNFDNTQGIWKGLVTDANNGGFIGIRSTPSLNYDMSQCRGIAVKVQLAADNNKKTKKAGKKRFKMVTRDSTDFNGITWATSVDITTSSTTPTTWTIPFDRQIPTRFAQIVPNQTFNRRRVAGFQMAFSKFEYEGKLNPTFEVGNVELRVLEIRAL